LPSPSRRSSRASIPVFASYTKSMQRKSANSRRSLEQSIAPVVNGDGNGVKREVENGTPPVAPEPKKRKVEEDDHGESIEEEIRKAHRYSDRVGALSSREMKPLLIEDPNWSLTEHMSHLLSGSSSRSSTSTPSDSLQELLPHFIYSTEPYWGSASAACTPSTNRDLVPTLGASDNKGNETVSADCGTAYQCCCKCQGDCAKNPTCPCIMRLPSPALSPFLSFALTPHRNGQRSPYSKDGLFDFSKGKIYECGPECSCQKNICSLRLTQHGVSLPLVVCRVGSKGYGVMSTKVSHLT
jgi:hypothetical protein